MKPLCFVLMPFGEKLDTAGGMIDFDAVYEQVIRPAVAAAEVEPIRADEETAGGIIHKPMFERLILCEYAVADLTTANPNVFYELGVRHGIRPQSTVMVFARQSRLPFDLAPLRAMPYALVDGKPDAAVVDANALTGMLEAARGDLTDSPVFQLVDGLPPADISRLKTDVFRERVECASGVKDELARARREGVDAVVAVQAGIGAIDDAELGVLIDLFLSYRAVKAWDRMIDLVDQMPGPLARSVLVREQLALALNRAGRGAEAEAILLELIDEHGPSSETYGILGRVYKDRWAAAVDPLEARGLLGRAIDAYVKGFEADWRDAYPGVNAVTLMELAQPPDERRRALLPVVRYASARRVAAGAPDYWDHATLLELAVLAGDEAAAAEHAGRALASVREVWEAESTIGNLDLIREARVGRGEDVAWLEMILASFRRASRQGTE